MIDPECDEFDQDMRLENQKDLSEICGSFINMDPSTSIIDLPHFSVQEYWKSTSLPDRSKDRYFIDERVANELIFRFCFSYLRYPRFSETDYTLRDDFFQTAAFREPYHAKPTSEKPSTASSILSFLESSSFDNWALIWHQFAECNRVLYDVQELARFRAKPLIDLEGCNHVKTTPLYSITVLSFRQAIKAMLDKQVNPINAVVDTNSLFSLPFSRETPICCRIYLRVMRIPIR